MLNKKKYNIRTDLVIDIFKDIKDDKIKVNKKKNNNIEILDIEVLNNKNKINKKKGKYITISFNDYNNKELENIIVKEIKKLLKYLNISIKSKCLVIGLGNRYITPDSLGPKVIDNILVTKYLYDMKGIKVNKNYRNVSAFCPSVKGNTGIESKDIILGIIKETKPDFIIVIDALASNSIDRINKTIQMTTSGINPGSGVYNNRCEISYETLSIPVIAIGIPTVIEAITLITDTFAYIFKYFSKDKLTFKDKKILLGEIGILNENKLKELIYEVLDNINYNMMVTPKEIDYLIEKESIILSNSINKALHKNFDI